MSAPRGRWGHEPLILKAPFPTLDEYLMELELTLKSITFQRSAKNATTHFANFLHREGVTHPLNIDRMVILRFQAMVNGSTTWAESYKQQLMKMVRHYMNWLTDVGHIPANPWVRIKVGVTPKRPKPLSDEELNMLFAAHKQGAFTMSPFTYHRREMILALLFSWGLRVHELEALTIAAMDTRLDFVTCVNKGGGTKVMPFSPELKKIYQRYVTQRGRYAKTGIDALIITSEGERMNKDYISKIVADLGRAAGLDINAHMLRDTCGTNMLDANVPIERVAKLLGHANVRMALAYSEVRDKKVAEDHERAMDPRIRLLFGNTRDLAG